MRLLASSVVVALLLIAACSDSTGGDTTPIATEAGAGTEAGPIVPVTDANAPGSDAAKDAAPDAQEPLSNATEVEPNNGQPETAVGTIALPGTMNGTIAPANDVDLFSVALAPGDVWEWIAMPTSADLAPHLTVFDTTAGNKNPIVVGFAGAGAPATLQHFVLNPGTFILGVRDARNVGGPGNQGGATFGYAVTGKRATLQPTPITFPTTKTGTLASIGSIALYTFTGTGGKGFDIVVNAQRKVPASTLNSRLSLYDPAAKRGVITNDNVSATVTDSQIGGDALPGTYVVVVENEGKNDADLSFEIQFTLRP